MTHFNESPAVLWDLITDFPNQITWRTSLQSVERLPDRNGRDVWREIDEYGHIQILETVESFRSKRLVRRTVNHNLHYLTTRVAEISEYGEVTALTITEETSIQNPLLQFISDLLIERTSSIDEYLRDLGHRLDVEVTISSA